MWLGVVCVDFVVVVVGCGFGLVYFFVVGVVGCGVGLCGVVVY